MSRAAWFSGLLVATCAYLLVGGVILLFAGCAAVPQPASPQQAVYALEGEYAAALAVGAAYNDLPRCPSTRDGLCSDAAKVEQLRDAVKSASAAITVVEATARANGDVASALVLADAIVNSLRLITADMKVKP